MFYLNQYFKIIFKSPVRGFSFFVFSILLVVSLSQKEFFEKSFLKMIPENKAGSYFYALISGHESYEQIARQLRALPGVYKVQILNEEEIKKEVKNILGSFEVDLTNIELNLNYVGLKVIMTLDLRPRSQELIREYLKHLAGEFNVTMGAVKTNDQLTDKRTLLVEGIKKWSYSIYLMILFIFWTLSLGLLKTKISEVAYLLENYQRRRKIGLKMALNGHMLFFFAAASLSFLWGMPNLIYLGMALLIFIVGILLHSKNIQWENR